MEALPSPSHVATWRTHSPLPTCSRCQPGETAPFPVAVEPDPHSSVRAQERLRRELDNQV